MWKIRKNFWDTTKSKQGPNSHAELPRGRFKIQVQWCHLWLEKTVAIPQKHCTEEIFFPDGHQEWL